MPVNNLSISPSYALLLAFIILSGCATIAKYDQYAYSQATSIKVDALNLMDSATDNYQHHQPEIAQVINAIDKIYEYKRNRPKNLISEKMWFMIRDTSGHLYGGFIKRWQREGTLDKVFIQQSKLLIGQSFDQISQLESGKIKPSQVSNY